MTHALDDIAKLIGGRIIGDGNQTVCGAAPFELAESNQITYAGEPRFLKRLNQTKADAVIVPQGNYTTSKSLVLADHPQVAFARVLNLFYPGKKPIPGISPLASTGKNFISGQDVSVQPFVSIGDGVSIGNRTVLYPGVFIGDEVVIGDDVTIYSNVSILERCRIGSRVIIHAGAVIGSDGFGFASDGERYHKIPHLGFVQIDDDVEIGAGNTIDRGTFGKTRVMRGVKTDNLVHIAHNVTVGEDTVIVAQAGIAGSVKIGRHVILAGQAGIAGHLEIGDDVTIGPQAGVAKSIPKGETVSGSPEMPHPLWLRVHRILPRLPELKKRILEIEKRLAVIEGKNGKTV